MIQVCTSIILEMKTRLQIGILKVTSLWMSRGPSLLLFLPWLSFVLTLLQPITYFSHIFHTTSKQMMLQIKSFPMKRYNVNTIWIWENEKWKLDIWSSESNLKFYKLGSCCSCFFSVGVKIEPRIIGSYIWNVLQSQSRVPVLGPVTITCNNSTQNDTSSNNVVIYNNRNTKQTIIWHTCHKMTEDMTNLMQTICNGK